MLACCIVVVYKMMLRMYPIPSLTDDISAIKYHFGLIEISISVFIWSLFRCNGHCSVSLLLSCFGFPEINGSLSQIQGPLLLLLLSRFSRVRLCDPRDGSPPGSPVPGILQARTLEWVAISFSNAWKGKVKVKLLSRVRLFATPWTAAHQAPPSTGFTRQECWSGVPLPSPKVHC